MFGIKEANEYMTKMRNVVGRHLNISDSIYYGKDGHLRLARECGYALMTLMKQDRKKFYQVVMG